MIFSVVRIKKGEPAPYDGVIFTEDEVKESRQRITKLEMMLEEVKLDLLTEKKIFFHLTEELKLYKASITDYNSIIATHTDLAKLTKMRTWEYHFYRIAFWVSLGLVLTVAAFEAGHYVTNYINSQNSGYSVRF